MDLGCKGSKIVWVLGYLECLDVEAVIALSVVAMLEHAPASDII